MAITPSITDLASEEFCYLTTIGRTSGLPREIEIWFGVSNSKLYMLSGNRDGSNWVRNILQDAGVTVRISGHSFKGNARQVDPADAEDARARELLLSKYQPIYRGDLTNWSRTSLPIAVDFAD